MEPAGLAMGVVGLAGLFGNAVDCFEYVQLARSSGLDFATSQLKLDVARLRLSRWGQSVGLGGEREDATGTTLQGDSASEAGRILNHINELFIDAEKISGNFIKAETSSSQAVFDPATDLDPACGTLHAKMSAMSRKRQPEVSLRRKAKWALHDGKRFSRLVENITDFVDALVELCPAARQQQQALSEQEVSELEENESLPVLQNAISGQDKDLDDAISKALAQHGPVSNTWNTSGNAKVAMQAGTANVHGSHTFNL